MSAIADDHAVLPEELLAARALPAATVPAAGISSGGESDVAQQHARLAKRHLRQRAVARLAAPIWVPLAALVLRFGLGYRLRGVREARAAFAKLRRESPTGLLICANHLTLIDSFLVAWALTSPWRLMTRIDDLPWNLPEVRNFASRWWSRALCYVAKCLPVERGGPREGVAEVLARVGHLLRRGEIALIFPEGGRSRAGRVDPSSAAWGVGRVLAGLPGCRVLCVYLRGDRQLTWSDYPSRGDRFSIQLECFTPASDRRGARRSVELAKQVVEKLAQLEGCYFRDR